MEINGNYKPRHIISNKNTINQSVVGKNSCDSKKSEDLKNSNGIYGKALVNLSFKGNSQIKEEQFSGEELEEIIQEFLQYGVDIREKPKKLEYFNRMNIDFARTLLKDEDIEFKEDIGDVLKYINKDNIDFAFELYDKKEEFDLWATLDFRDILISVNKDNVDFARKINPKQLQNYFKKTGLNPCAANFINKTNQELILDLCKNEDNYPYDFIKGVAQFTNEDNINLARRLCFETDYEDNIYNITRILSNTCEIIRNNRGDVTGNKSKGKEIVAFANMLLDKKDEFGFSLDEIGSITAMVNEDNINFIIEQLPKKNGYKTIKSFSNYVYKDNKEFVSEFIRLLQEQKFENFDIQRILTQTNKDNIDFAAKLCSDEDFLLHEHAVDIIESSNPLNMPLAYRLCFGEDINPSFKKSGLSGFVEKIKNKFSSKKQPFPRICIASVLGQIKEYNLELASRLCLDEKLNFPKRRIERALYVTNEDNIELAKILYTDKKLKFDTEEAMEILYHTNKHNIELAKRLCTNKELDFPRNEIHSILSAANEENIDFINEIFNDKDLNFSNDDIVKISKLDNIKETKEIYKQIKTGEIPVVALYAIINKNGVSPKDIRHLTRLMGRDKIASMNPQEVIIAARLSELYKKQDINEISLVSKKEILRELVACNTGMFEVGEDFKKDFPLIPTNQEQYCELLPSLVRSLGIETNTLDNNKIDNLNCSILNLSNTLAQLSDDEFNNLEIKQEYPKDDFIKDTLSVVKDMPKEERQKVYDYFGFELHHNKANETGFSIAGYPVNLNNGKKLAKITNPETKKIVEELRPYVIKFSQNNEILCNNNEIAKLLNDIVLSFPELRTQIGRCQHGLHVFDVFKHSLKVMQKIAQNPEFETLNDSDKKVMLLAALFHDITKSEGRKGKLHADTSAFDAFYITNKLNLVQDEKIKLYSIIKNHEWFGYINSADNATKKEELEKSSAYDFQYDNLFKMSEIFTDADLKSVRDNDDFYNANIDARIKCSNEIKNYIEELKKSKPLLPVTKIPNADRIDSEITKVNNDYSTNLKGVYKTPEGLIVIKFNEVEDFEKIGFSEGSTSKGIKAKGVSGQGNKTKEVDIETGNIKFFAHGLDYSNQLAKFDAFALPDSDALLSVSYTERPESKYRFFKTQGVLLNVDTKYIHGGGNTDSGSGYGKNIDEFKKNYAYEGSRRYEDRIYISNLIKEALNLNDEEYVEFVRKNANKEMAEIEPIEAREKIIKALASINSNTRKGNREYNEMYASNPEVMGVFAYDADDKINNIKAFLNKTINNNGFLREYAIKNNVPMIIFGD